MIPKSAQRFLDEIMRKQNCEREIGRQDRKYKSAEKQKGAHEAMHALKSTFQKAQPFSAAASAASLVIPAQSPAATSSFGATQEPPTQMTFGSDR